MIIGNKSMHKRTEQSKNSLPEEAINKLELLSSDLKPTSILIFAKRYFRKDTWHLIDDRTDYTIGEKKLYELQIKLVQDIISLGDEKIIDFSKTVEDPYIVGVCVAELKAEKQLETQILNCLENKNANLIEFSKGYVYKQFSLKGYPWIIKSLP